MFGEVDISAESARLGIWVAAAMGILNALANILNAWYSKRTKERLELARIAAQSAENIARINATEAAKAHQILRNKVNEVQASINTLTDAGT